MAALGAARPRPAWERLEQRGAADRQHVEHQHGDRILQRVQPGGAVLDRAAVRDEDPDLARGRVGVAADVPGDLLGGLLRGPAARAGAREAGGARARAAERAAQPAVADLRGARPSRARWRPSRPTARRPRRWSAISCGWAATSRPSPTSTGASATCSRASSASWRRWRARAPAAARDEANPGAVVFSSDDYDTEWRPGLRGDRGQGFGMRRVLLIIALPWSDVEQRQRVQRRRAEAPRPRRGGRRPSAPSPPAPPGSPRPAGSTGSACPRSR